MYADHPAISTALVFLHLGGILLAGGFAISTDRSILQATVRPELRARCLSGVPPVHRIVKGALFLAAGAGILIFLADVEALATSPVFWVKMLLVTLLIGNGYGMMRAEKALAVKDPVTDRNALWQPLARAARFSLALWFSTLLAGVALRNV